MAAMKGTQANEYGFGVPLMYESEETTSDAAQEKSDAMAYTGENGDQTEKETSYLENPFGFSGALETTEGGSGAAAEEENSVEAPDYAAIAPGVDQLAESSDSGMLFKLHPRRETEGKMDAPAETEPEMVLNLHPRRETESILGNSIPTETDSSEMGALVTEKNDMMLPVMDVEEEYPDPGMEDNTEGFDESHALFVGRRDTDNTSGTNGGEHAESSFAVEEHDDCLDMEQASEHKSDHDDLHNSEDHLHRQIPNMLLEDEDPEMPAPGSARPTEDSQDRPNVQRQPSKDEKTVPVPIAELPTADKQRSTSDGFTITEMPAGFFNEEYELGTGPKEGEVITMRSERGIKDAEAKQGMIIIGVAAVVIAAAGGGLHAFAASKSATSVMTFTWPLLAGVIVGVTYATWATGWSQAVAMQNKRNAQHPFLAVSRNGHELQGHETVLWGEYQSRIRAIRDYARSQGIEKLKQSKAKKRPRTRVVKEPKLDSVVVVPRKDGDSSKSLIVGAPAGSQDGVVPPATTSQYIPEPITNEPYSPHQGSGTGEDDMSNIEDSGNELRSELESPGAKVVSPDKEREVGSPLSSSGGGSAGVAGAGDGSSDRGDVGDTEYPAAVMTADDYLAPTGEGEDGGLGHHEEPDAVGKLVATSPGPDVPIIARSRSSSDEEAQVTKDNRTATNARAEAASESMETGRTAGVVADSQGSAQEDDRTWLYRQDPDAQAMDDFGANHVVQEETVNVALDDSAQKVIGNLTATKESASNTSMSMQGVKSTESLSGSGLGASEVSGMSEAMVGNHALAGFEVAGNGAVEHATTRNSRPKEDMWSRIGHNEGVYASGARVHDAADKTTLPAMASHKVHTIASTTATEGSFMLHRTASDLENMAGYTTTATNQPAVEKPIVSSIYGDSELMTDTDTKQAMLHRSLYGSVFN